MRIEISPLKDVTIEVINKVKDIEAKMLNQEEITTEELIFILESVINKDIYPTIIMSYIILEYTDILSEEPTLDIPDFEKPWQPHRRFMVLNGEKYVMEYDKDGYGCKILSLRKINN